MKRASAFSLIALAVGILLIPMLIIGRENGKGAMPSGFSGILEPEADSADNPPFMSPFNLTENGEEQEEEIQLVVPLQTKPSGFRSYGGGGGGNYNNNGPSCGDGSCNGNENCNSCSQDCGSCLPICGNGAKEGDEECDDNNNNDGDGCSFDCRIEYDCPARSPGYWKNHEGCPYGSSSWAEGITDLSNGYEGYFNLTGAEVCTQLDYGGNDMREKAERHVLTDYLNTVSGKLDLNALIANAGNITAASNLGLGYYSTIDEAFAVFERILSNGSATQQQLEDVKDAAEAIYTFYETQKECIYGCDEDSDCDDDLFCTVDICNSSANQCEHSAKTCDDNINCTIDSCDEINDTCVNNPNDTLCPSDTVCADNYCNQTLGCQMNYQPPATECRASNGICDPAEYCTGNTTECPADAKSTAQCRDAVGECDTAEYCDGIDDDCPADSFEPLSTSCEADDDLCTIDHCDGNGECVEKEIVECPAGDPCTSYSCNPANGECEDDYAEYSTPCETDDDLCTNEHCDGSGHCVFLDEVECQSDTECASFRCNPATGVCDEYDEPLSTLCNSDNSCGINHCDGYGECVFDYEVGCDDEDECTTDRCDSEFGCRYTLINCDDSVACTVDSCDSIDGCVNILDNSLCDDNDVCSGIEVCDAELGCQEGTPLSCDDNNICNGVETCDAYSGCQSGAPLDCDDRDPCTIDGCDAIEGCQHAENPECVCQTDDDCSQLSDQCNIGRCNLQNYECYAEPKQDSTPCDDGQYCTENDVCVEGSCNSGLQRDCSDSVSCTADSCNEGTDSCQNTPQDILCPDTACADFYCDAQEDCQAVYQPSTTLCRAAAGVCDIAEYCTGFSALCPGDEFRLSSTECDLDSRECTIDHCDGAGSCVQLEDNCPVCGNLIIEDGEVCEMNSRWSFSPPRGQQYVCNDDNTYRRCVDCLYYENVNSCTWRCSSDYMCGGLQPGTYLESCEQYGEDYLEDFCDYHCHLTDSSCESDYARCFADSECDELIPGQDNCNAYCEYTP